GGGRGHRGGRLVGPEDGDEIGVDLDRPGNKPTAGGKAVVGDCALDRLQAPGGEQPAAEHIFDIAAGRAALDPVAAVAKETTVLAVDQRRIQRLEAGDGAVEFDILFGADPGRTLFAAFGEEIGLAGPAEGERLV